MTAFVAILRQNVSAPIVYGLGQTADAARADAAQWTDGTAELEVLPCTPELAAAVESGRSECVVVNGVATVDA